MDQTFFFVLGKLLSPWNSRKVAANYTIECGHRLPRAASCVRQFIRPGSGFTRKNKLLEGKLCSSWFPSAWN